MKSNNIVFFIPSIEGGGVEKNLFLIINYFCKSYDKIYIITSSFVYSNFPKNVHILTPNKKKWFNSSRIYKNIISSWILFKLLTNEKNIKIFSFQANVYAIIIAKLKLKKIVIRLNSSPQGWAKNKFHIFLFKFFYSLADRIIVNSYEFKKEIKKIFNLNAVTIYNPLNKYEIINKSRKRINDNFFNKKKTIKILNIGRLTKQKNQMLILEAIKILKKKYNFKLYIIGKGNEKDNLRLFIKKNKLKNFVKIKNFVKNPYPFIKRCDLFVLSSVYEGLPNVLIEAQLLNKIIISTSCPTGPKEILMNGRAGILVKNNDLNAFVSKIEFFFKNKKKLKNLAVYGKKNIERFNFNINMKKYLKNLMLK